jgi:hypothetical protein
MVKTYSIRSLKRMKMKGIPAVAVKSKTNPDIPEFYRLYNRWGAIFYSMNRKPAFLVRSSIYLAYRRLRPCAAQGEKA